MDLPPEAFSQDGRFTYQQARAFGITHHRLYSAVGNGLLVSPRPGLFAPADGADVVDPVLRHAILVREAQLASKQPWAAARRSAALLMGLPLIGQPPEVPLLLRDGEGSKTHGRDRFARVGPFPSAHRWEYGGVLMSNPARTVVDVARAESFRNGVVLADGVLRRGVERHELESVLVTMKHWPGVAAARSVVRFADGRAESPGESLVRVACLVEQLPIPEPQVEVYRYGQLVARLDHLIRKFLLAIEFDGAIKFTDAGVLPALLSRHEEIMDCGIGVLRTNWNETFKDTSTFGRRLRDRLRERGVRRLPPGVELRSTEVRPQAPLLGWTDLAAA